VIADFAEAGDYSELGEQFPLQFFQPSIPSPFRNNFWFHCSRFSQKICV
jgi:hypothetical protein